MENKTLVVEGMSCEHCAGSVKKALGEIAGVANAAVNLKAGTVSLSLDPAIASIEAVKAAITDAGYEVVKVVNE